MIFFFENNGYDGNEKSSFIEHQRFDYVYL